MAVLGYWLNKVKIGILKVLSIDYLYISMYVVAEEAGYDETSTGNVVIVSSVWLTPRKLESHWPNSKFSTQYNKLLQKHVCPTEDWSIIKLKRTFFETDDILLARKKAREAEINSDVTDGEHAKRKKRPASKLVISSDDEELDIFDSHKSTGKLVKIFENPIQPSTEDSNLTTPTQILQRTAEDSAATTPAQILQRAGEDSAASTPARILQRAAEGSAASTSTQSIGNLKGLGLPTLQQSSTSSSTRSVDSLSAYEHKSLRLLTTVVEQNNQILNWIRVQNEFDINKTRKNDIELPIAFPIHQEDELRILETYLETDNNLTELCNYFTSFAAISRTGTVNAILKHCLTNKLAAKFNYRGHKGKQAFVELSLRVAIIRTVKRMFKLPTEKDIENDIKVWLKHAPQRLSIQEKKSTIRYADRIQFE